MNNPLISIITVCFNSEKTIRKTIESVLNQTYSNIEYILVDGNSTDSTVGIIKEYQPQFQAKGISYRYISEPDDGIYDAMNKGISLASGELVGIINSDDWYELNACELIAKAYQNNSNFSVFAGTLRYIAELDGVYYSRLIPSEYKDMNIDMYLQHPTVFIKATLYITNKFDTSYKIIADWALLRNLYNTGAKTLILDDIIANFRDGGVSNKYGIPLIEERMKLFNDNLNKKLLIAYIKEKIKLYRKIILHKIKPKWFTKMSQRKMILSTCTIYDIKQKH